eukprot:COSAG02_NODE_7156_length_3150_cov_714.062275_2_plen_183_part_00
MNGPQHCHCKMLPATQTSHSILFLAWRAVNLAQSGGWRIRGSQVDDISDESDTTEKSGSAQRFARRKSDEGALATQARRISQGRRKDCRVHTMNHYRQSGRTNCLRVAQSTQTQRVLPSTFLSISLSCDTHRCHYISHQKNHPHHHHHRSHRHLYPTSYSSCTLPQAQLQVRCRHPFRRHRS